MLCIPYVNTYSAKIHVLIELIADSIAKSFLIYEISLSYWPKICKIFKDIDGDTMYITTMKTYDRLPINLNKFAREILAKYDNPRYPDGLALPVLPNQLMNRYLKHLCELAGFNTPITRICYRGGERIEETYPKSDLISTHAGRRTFICFALSSGIPPQVVMKWTGHSDYQAMKPYIDIAEKTKADAMKLFESELSK